MDNGKIVLFLGAGFSCDAGFPTMASFGSESKREYLGISHPGNKRKPSQKILLEAGDVFKKFQKYAMSISDLMSIDCDNMEDIFCLADIIEGTCMKSKLTIPEVDNLSITEIIEKIRLWLWKVFQQCPPINDQKPLAQKNVNAYENFFRFIIERHKECRDISIITTNYDLMPEFFLNNLNEACTYAIRKEYSNEWMTHSESVNRFAYINDNALIPIYKLHGSVNYFFNSTNNKNIVNIVVDKLNCDIDGVGRSHASVFRNNLSILPLDAINELRRLNIDKIPIPAIIPPMYSKIESMPWLKNIWENALRAISEARVIAFIGYSFPQSDGFMQSFFQAAMMKRKKQKTPEIINLDINDGTKFRYGSIFKNLKSNNFLTGSFVNKYTDLIERIKRNS